MKKLALRIAAICVTVASVMTTHVLAAAPQSAEDIKPILVGQSLPSITVLDAQGKPFNVNKALARKPALIVFYRGGWCPYCNTHLANLRKIEDDLKGMGIQIMAISPDLPKYLQQTGDKQQLEYTLLSDSKMTASQALGLAFEVDAETIKLYRNYDIDLEKSSGETHHLLPVPAALLVDKDGTVVFTFVAPNYKVRVDNGVILAAAKSLSNTK